MSAVDCIVPMRWLPTVNSRAVENCTPCKACLVCVVLLVWFNAWNLSSSRPVQFCGLVLELHYARASCTFLCQE